MEKKKLGLGLYWPFFRQPDLFTSKISEVGTYEETSYRWIKSTHGDYLKEYRLNEIVLTARTKTGVLIIV